jgi:Tol biopolymer transport system component
MRPLLTLERPRAFADRVKGVATKPRLPTTAVALTALVLLLAGPGAAAPRHGGRLLFQMEVRFCDDCASTYTVDGDGSNLRALRFVGGALSSGALSPGGDRFVTSAYEGSSTAVKVKSLTGLHARTIARFRSELAVPDWSPDSRRIAVSTTRQVWVVSSTARRSARRIVSFERAKVTGPTWSPLGTQIAFGRSYPQAGLVAIYVVRPDGSGLHQVVSPRLLTGVSWSPDDRQLIFSAYPNGNAAKSTLHLIDVNTRSSKSLGRGSGPLWAPQGGRIAFSVPGPAGASRISVSRADGSGRKVLGNGLPMAWSPDGSRLAAVAPAGRRYGLVTMRPDGRGRRMLFTPLHGGMFFVDWAR